MFVHSPYSLKSYGEAQLFMWLSSNCEHVFKWEPGLPQFCFWVKENKEYLPTFYCSQLYISVLETINVFMLNSNLLHEILSFRLKQLLGVLLAQIRFVAVGMWLLNQI